MSLISAEKLYYDFHITQSNVPSSILSDDVSFIYHMGKNDVVSLDSIIAPAKLHIQMRRVILEWR